MTDLTDRLQAALGDAYRVERELGGGGMSRVFLAEEVALGRYVVVKVLPPELAADVSAERFRREIQLAASLQHPHIVPLLTAGAAGDLLYYVMPYIVGESLRAKLTREIELPVAETVHILREVLDALSEAHARGVVHRDIKPDNVLLSGKHALVTDFGVAKAVSEAAQGTNLTSLGVALGTPAYMAPEQAAAEPHLDHRADIYAFGVMCYEMLAGRPPFTGPTVQAILAAHLTQAPEPCTTYRPTVPPALSALVSRCLEKKAADRPQSVEEVLTVLDAMATPSGGTAPSDAVAVSSGTREAVARHSPARVAVLSAVGGAAVLATVFALVRLVGLPAWVAPATVAILAIGLPFLLLTARQERRRVLEKSTGHVPTTSGALTRYFTWKRATLAGGVAFGLLAVLTGGYLAMRQLGIGAVGTLIAKGTLSAHDLIVMGDFENRTADSTDGRTIQELFRIDLEQSPVVRLVGPTQVTEALARMGLAAGTPLTADVARELAEREGAKAVLTGEIAPLGNGYVVSVRLLHAATGEVLVARRETAAGRDGLIAAVDGVSRGLRERIGESLRRVQGGPALDQVTTASFEALKKYTESSRAQGEGRWGVAVTLLQDAVRLDSLFGMAYRRLGVRLAAIAPRREWVPVLTKAFDLRARLTERERLVTEAQYYGMVLQDRDRVLEAYNALAARYPEDTGGLNGLGNQYSAVGRYAEAESAYTRAIELAGWGGVWASNLIETLLAQGKLDEAEVALRHWADAHPDHPELPSFRASLALLRGDYDGAETIIRDAVPAWRAAGPGGRLGAEEWLIHLALLKGRVREAGRIAVARSTAARDAGAERLPAVLSEKLYAALTTVWFGHAQAAALAALDTALARYPMDSIPPEDRHYPEFAEVFALGGEQARAREFMRHYEREASDVGPFRRAQALHYMSAQIALAEENWPVAIAEFTEWERGEQPVNVVWLADAYDRSGQADSALAIYERWMATPTTGLGGPNPVWFPRTLRRLGALYEARGDGTKASEYYRRFAELWADADFELQPMVREARAKAERLGSR